MINRIPLLVATVVAALGLYLAQPIALQAQVKFHQGDWNSLLAEAKKTNKPFFVDFYATWCGPCKLMDKNTFGDATFGTYANGKFVPYKLDAEKGEGPALAQKYAINGYPTIVVFDPNGQVLEKIVGYRSPDALQTILQKHAK
jgi:thiol:disulfide interchange protein